MEMNAWGNPNLWKIEDFIEERKDFIGDWILKLIQDDRISNEEVMRLSSGLNVKEAEEMIVAILIKWKINEEKK